MLDRRAHAQKRRLSVITQEYSMRQDMTIEEVMEYQGRLYFMKRRQIREKTEELLDFTNLLEYRRRTVRHLSGGMKRKLQNRGMTVLLTTHYMEEAQTLCDRVALMDRGKINTVAPPRELIDRLGRFAVDEITDEKTISRFFHDREEAIRCLQEAGSGAGMRETTLEDVFLERLGRHLEKK